MNFYSFSTFYMSEMCEYRWIQRSPTMQSGCMKVSETLEMCPWEHGQQVQSQSLSLTLQLRSKYAPPAVMHFLSLSGYRTIAAAHFSPGIVWIAASTEVIISWME